MHVARDKKTIQQYGMSLIHVFSSPEPEKTHFITCMLPAGTVIVTGFVLSALCIYSPDRSDCLCILSTVLYIVLSDLLVSRLFSLLFSNKVSGLLEKINIRNRFPSMTDCRSKCTVKISVRAFCIYNFAGRVMGLAVQCQLSVPQHFHLLFQIQTGVVSIIS